MGKPEIIVRKKKLVYKREECHNCKDMVLKIGSIYSNPVVKGQAVTVWDLEWVIGEIDETTGETHKSHFFYNGSPTPYCINRKIEKLGFPK